MIGYEMSPLSETHVCIKDISTCAGRCCKNFVVNTVYLEMTAHRVQILGGISVESVEPSYLPGYLSKTIGLVPDWSFTIPAKLEQFPFIAQVEFIADN